MLLDLFLERKSVACGVKNPWVIIRTLHACVQAKSFTRQFPSVQRTCIWQWAERLAFDIAFFLPLSELPSSGDLRWVLHPLNNLEAKRIWSRLLAWGKSGTRLVIHGTVVQLDTIFERFFQCNNIVYFPDSIKNLSLLGFKVSHKHHLFARRDFWLRKVTTESIYNSNRTTFWGRILQQRERDDSESLRQPCLIISWMKIRRRWGQESTGNY